MFYIHTVSKIILVYVLVLGRSWDYNGKQVPEFLAGKILKHTSQCVITKTSKMK